MRVQNKNTMPGLNLGGGLRVFTIRGIPIRLHPSLLLVLPLLAFGFGSVFTRAAEVAGIPPDRVTLNPWAFGLIIAVALFASVLVHELAHSLYALRTGGKVKGITLMIVGGVSHLSVAPDKPKQEAIMAFAGPAVSLLLAAIFFTGWAALAGASSFDLRFAFFHLGYLNLVLAMFNLVPAFPMDGGRILRALLSIRLGNVRATHIASIVGRGFALLFGIAGVMTGNVVLLIIAAFVWMGARGEKRQVEADAELAGLKVSDVMHAPPIAGAARDVLMAGPLARTDEPLVIAYRRLADEEVPMLAVVDADGNMAGLLDWNDVQLGLRLRALARAGKPAEPRRWPAIPFREPHTPA